jgi:hypothetical protein
MIAVGFFVLLLYFVGLTFDGATQVYYWGTDSKEVFEGKLYTGQIPLYPVFQIILPLLIIVPVARYLFTSKKSL